MTRPIPLPDYAARALAEGRLTQWRVRLRVQPEGHDICVDLGAGFYAHAAHDGTHMGGQWRLPFKGGDSPWVQETWHPTLFGDCPVIEYKNDAGGDEYLGNAKPITVEQFDAVDGPRRGWRFPVTMPKWASRWTLTVESVRVERCHNATFLDAKEEGVRQAPGDDSRLETYARIWNSRHGPGSWERNDWCCVARVSVERRGVDA